MTTAKGYIDTVLDLIEPLALDRLPADTRAAAVTFTADTIGVGLAACQLDDVQRQRRLARGWGAGDCLPLGGGIQLSAPQAAYINGLQIHCQEYDAVHEAAVVHAMSVVSAACLSDCQRVPHRVGDYLTAIVAGVELAVNLGVASRAPMRFFRPATAGLMGAALALCKLNGADRQTYKNTLGLAYALLSGTMQSHLEGSPALAYQVAFAARNALFAYDMAQAGSTGPHDVVEGPFGYLALIEGASDLPSALARFGQPWAICELSHKPYPTGRAAHSVLRMVDDVIASENLSADDIETITALVPPLIKRLIDRPYDGGLSLSQARLCLPYLVATRFLRGPIKLDTYVADWYVGNTWQSFADKVSIELDGNDDPNALDPQALRVSTRDGRNFELQAPVTLGHPRYALSDEQQYQKFCDCLDYGGVDVGPGRRWQWAMLLALGETYSLDTAMSDVTAQFVAAEPPCSD